jgi:hypothetical protein
MLLTFHSVQVPSLPTHLLSLQCFPLTALPTEVLKYIALEVTFNPASLPLVLPYTSWHFSAPVGSLVYDRCKCISLHYPPPPFLTDGFAGRLALETPDEQNDIIKPYIVMSFKVCAFVFSISLSSHILPYSLFFALIL